MRRKLKIFMAAFLAMSMLLSVSVISLAQASDIKGSWAEAQIREWVDLGLVQGYPDGTFKPENPIMRAEYFTLLNRAFGFFKKSDSIFSDVSAKDWFAGDIAIGKAQGYLTGDGSKAMPRNNITREEVMATLARILKLEPDEAAASKYADSTSIDPWARGYVGAVSKLGCINDYKDNTVRAKQNATRAEVVYMLNKVVGALYNKAGAFGPSSGTSEVTGNITVSKPDITLKSLVIDGNLYISEGIGDGSVTLDNVTVKGTTIVNASAKMSGSFEKLDIQAPKARLSILGGSVKSFLVNGGESEITLDKSVTIDTLTVNQPTKMTGMCTIDTASINSSNVTIEANPKAVIKAANLTNVSVTQAPVPIFASGSFPVTPPPPVEIRVTGYEPFTDRTPASGTPIEGISLPPSINVTLSDGTKASYQVTWDTSTYNENVDGLYTFPGTISIPQGSNVILPDTISQTVKINVIVGLSLVSVTPVNLSVSVGTEWSKIHPPATVTGNLSDGTTIQRPVIWPSENNPYNGNAQGVYSLIGNVTWPDVINPMDHKAIFNVYVGMNIEVDMLSIDVFPDTNVLLGTALSSIVLPETVTVNLGTGSTDSYNVIWDTSSYNGNVLDTYIFPGTISIPDGVNNPLNLTRAFRVNVVNPLADPNPGTPLRPEGTTLDACDSLVGWTSTSNLDMAVDTSIKVQGTASLALTANLAGGALGAQEGYQVTKAFDQPLDLSSMTSVQFDIFIPDVTQTDRISLRFFTGDYSSWYHNCFMKLTNNWSLVNGWNRITISKNELDGEKYDSPSWRSISALKVIIFAKDGYKPSVNLDRISYVTGSSKAQVLFTFDDGYYDLMDPAIADNAFSYLSSRGFRATVWAKESSSGGYTGNARNTNETSSYLNETDLQVLYDAGWDIGNHTVSHPDSIEGLSDETLRSEFEDCQNWLLSKSWNRGAHFACYPSGNYNDRLISILQSIGVLAARTTVQSLQSVPVDNMYKLKVLYIDLKDPANSLADINVQIDEAIRKGSTVIFMLHRIENITGEVSIDNFKQLVDCVAGKGSNVEVDTISEWYEKYMGNLRITDVNPITNLNVPFGTQYEVLTLPVSVGVTLNNGSTRQLNVTWARGTYNGNIAGPHTLTGTLALPSGILNPLNRSASITVTVGQQTTVASIQPINDIQVPNGTEAAAIINLPLTVGVTLSDNSTATYPVTWNSTVYNKDVAGTYPFVGTLTLPANIANPNNLTATVNVIVAVTVTGVQTQADINVANGTEATAISLPLTVGITLNNGTTPTYPVIWSNPAYNKDVAGTYPFIGTLTLPATIANPNNLTASVNVIVGQAAVTVTGVQTLTDIHVANGTEFLAIGLPATVGVTLSNGTNPTYSVTWGEGDYNKDAAGTYPLTGTLTLPEGISNPQNRVASVNVIVGQAAVTVTGVQTLTDIHVANGTEFSAIGLPATVGVTLSNGTNPSYSVTWGEGDYNKDAAGTYALIGTLTLPEGISNPQNHAASVNVIVGQAAVTVTEVQTLADIHVANGTEFSAIGLPATVGVTLSNGTNPSYSVTWGEGDYNKDAAGTYPLTGALTLPAGVTNPGNRTASINVVVEEKAAVTVVSANSIPSMHVAFGTDISAITLPTSVTVTLSDGTTPSLNISSWDTSSYNKDVADTYAFHGTIALPEDVTNPNNTVATINIIVEAQVVTITNVDVIPDITVDFGTVAGSLGLPSQVGITLSDGTNTTADITWDTSNYTEDTAGTYDLHGTLTLPQGVENPNNMVALVKVTVSEAPPPEGGGDGVTPTV